jgi:Pvc16 N-terminal domain
MFSDVDETLRQILIADVPLDADEVDISFDRPTREWSGRLSRPALNLFLFDIRERVDFRDDSWRVSRNGRGQAVQERLPRRIDLAYMVTAWTREPADEHRILAGVLACTMRQAKVSAEHLRGALVNAAQPVLLRSMTPDELVKATDYWGVMDNEFHTSLTWVATVPLDVFARFEGPIVRTRELRVSDFAGGQPEVFIEVAGTVHAKGDLLAGIPDARVVVGAMEATTDAQGNFVFPRLPAGKHELQVKPPGAPSFSRPITVPSDSYDVEV